MLLQPEGGERTADVGPAAPRQETSLVSTGGYRPPVRLLLLGLVLACLLPGVLGIGLLGWRLYEEDREQSALAATYTARALALAVDAEFGRALTFATELARSNRLLAGDLAGFHEEARGLLTVAGTGSRVAVVDPDGAHRLNTLRPFAEGLPPLGNAEHIAQVMKDGRPAISNVFRSGLTGRSVLTASAPVIAGGRVQRIVCVVLDSEDLGRLLGRQGLPEGWIAGITDPAGITAARSRTPEPFVGQRVSDTLFQHLRRSPEGAYDSVTRDGTPSVIAFSHAPVSGWSVVIAVANRVQQQPWREDMLRLAGGVLLLFGLGGIVAWQVGGRIARSVQGMAGSAIAMASEQHVPAPELHFAEAAEAAQAIGRSVQMLTDRARGAEKSVAQRAAELAIANAQLADIYDSAPCGYHSLDDQGVITTANATELRMLGYSRDEYVGRPLTEFMTPASVELFRQRYPVFRQVGFIRDAEFDFVRKDGTVLPALVSAVVVRDAQGRHVANRAMVTDNSERKARQRQIDQMQRELARRAEEAEAATRSKSAFLANMSHEIRTPMNAIIGLAHLMSRDSQDALMKERLHKVDGAARHLLQVLNDILDLSKVDAGKMVLEDVEFSRDSLLTGAFEMVAEAAHVKGLELVLDADHLPERMRGDPKRLAQALINLLSNAVKFTERGWVRLGAELLAEDGERLQLRFEVRDTGLGIAPDRLGALFQAFEQADASTARRHGGTGLGLALTRHLATLMGGEAGADSEPGVGSRFWFTAWVHRAAPAAEAAPEPLPVKDLRALVVDDLPESREAIGEALSVLGLQAEAAADGHEAVRLAEAQARFGRAHDVLLIDWRMQPLDGIATLQALREVMGSGLPPCILVTAHDETTMWRQAREARFDAVLVKPITPSALHDALVRVLQRQGTSLPEVPMPGEELERELRHRHTGRRVLLAEDNPINQEVASALLSAVGLAVEVAADGDAAVGMALAHAYDLVLMDVQMPGTDGLEATRMIRQRLGPTMPIVAMTANAFEEDRRACLAAGMNDHVGKPVDPAVLYATLLRWLPRGAPPSSAPAPAAAAPAATLAERLAPVGGLDLAQALRNVGGQERILQRVMQAFVANYLHGLPDLLEPPSGETRQHWRGLCHSLHGACAAIGAVLLDRAALALERSLSAPAGVDDAQALAAQARTLHEDLQALAGQLGAALQG